GEQPPLLEGRDDRLAHLVGGEPFEGAVARDETAAVVDRRQNRELVDPPELEVLGAGTRRDVNDAGSFVERDLVPRDPSVDLALPALEREPHEEGRVLKLRVVLVARLLVLGERGPAAWAPLRRAVALVEPLAAMALLQEAPDVLDVRVREGEVVVAPIHPLAE